MQLQFYVSKPLNEVFEYLSDTQKFAVIHPVIYKIEHIAGNQYLIHEKMNVGFIPYAFTYKADIIANKAKNTIKMLATVNHLVKINLHFELIEHENITQIIETVEIHSFLPVKKIMQKMFKKLHAILFENLAKA